LQARHAVGDDHLLSIELKDVPGVARHNQESTPALDREVTLSRQSLTELCQEVGIRLER
jgi:hypothetical protein